MELFDLSLLKIKAASLPAIRRWDITRLMADNDERVKLFFLQKRSSLVSFLLTGISDSTGSISTAILWEPTVKDQWFAFMSNFAVLNKNEPYVETEEEFDFNQYADPITVERSMNRYRTSESVKFDFLPDKMSVISGGQEDTEMTDITREESDKPTQPVRYPFMQPLDNWRRDSQPIFKGQVRPQFTCRFFSDACPKVIEEALSRR
jgi:hypothetical protein